MKEKKAGRGGGGSLIQGEPVEPKPVVPKRRVVRRSKAVSADVIVLSSDED